VSRDSGERGVHPPGVQATCVRLLIKVIRVKLIGYERNTLGQTKQGNLGL
jgi:hypothetical protein